MDTCPNCDTKIKSSVFSTHSLLSDTSTKIINAHTGNNSTGYCSKCGSTLESEARTHFTNLQKSCKQRLNQLLPYIMVVSTHSPHGWEYDCLGIVTGQATMGTGLVTEFTSSFTDLFGMESGRHNSKVVEGEDKSMALMRSKAIEMGAHAIIAADIDYSEIGALKGMILVCTSGTAVKIKNLDVFPPNRRKAIEEIQSLYVKSQEVNEILR